MSNFFKQMAVAEKIEPIINHLRQVRSDLIGEGYTQKSGIALNAVHDELVSMVDGETASPDTRVGGIATTIATPTPGREDEPSRAEDGAPGPGIVGLIRQWQAGYRHRHPKHDCTRQEIVQGPEGFDLEAYCFDCKTTERLTVHI